MMKKIVIWMLNVLLLLSILGCSPSSSKSRTGAVKNEIKKEEQEEQQEIIEVTEKMYVAYINDIYTNPQNYINKKIKIQGMYKSYTDETTGKTFYLVYRTGPGCCGNDGATCGFEFTTQGELPKENDWIEVVGTLNIYEEDGINYLTISDSEVTVKAERGLEVVSN